MANIFWIPNSPIKDLTIQYAGRLTKDNYDKGDELSCVPTFLGYGTKGALSRFKVFLPSLRDPKKRHPASIGKRKGVNNPLNKEMDISKKFTGNFILTGITKNGSGVALGNCTVMLFRSSDDVKILTTTSDASGNFTLSLPNDSYKNYYLVCYLAGSPDVAGTSIDTLTLTQQ
jgi:hypothetical protein